MTRRVENEPVELAPRVWWVGSMLPEDQFQCHVYLVEQGDQSVLIDPGSALIATEVARKVDAVVGLEKVRWLVCSHSDPDILGGIPPLRALGLAPDAAIVTHWRDVALIRHTGYDGPFWPVDEHQWRLELADRTLRFVFTPYAHFAGSFATFDESTGVLFSSDLFGAFTADRSLVATSIDCFDGMRPFHEHYMPSNEALAHAIDQFTPLPIRLIAPQHGQVIPSELVQEVMSRLRSLECGLYLMAQDDPGLRFLFAANRTVHAITAAVVDEPTFAGAATKVAAIARDLLGAERVEFWAAAGESTLCFAPEDGFVGDPVSPPEDVAAAFAGDLSCRSQCRLLVPLGEPPNVSGVVVLQLQRPMELNDREWGLLRQVSEILSVAMEREVARRLTELDRADLYVQATHDSLTGLYNRLYLADTAARIFARDDRSEIPAVGVLLIDIDHFKSVNDQHGHHAGDEVLSRVAATIRDVVRSDDVPVRYGGEEFVVVLAQIDERELASVAERVRAAVAASTGPGPCVTVSVGAAIRRQGEACEALVARADRAMYTAKTQGRDRVVVAET